MGNCVSGCVTVEAGAQKSGQHKDCQATRSSGGPVLSKKQQAYLDNKQGSCSSDSGSGAPDANVCIVLDKVAAASKASAKDGASSTPQAFLSWAETQASAERKPVEQFISSNISVDNGSSEPGSCAPSSTRGSAPGTTSARPLSSAGGWASLFDSGPASSTGSLVPYQPHDTYLHGAPLPACHAERVATAQAVQRMRATENGELESMLSVLCKAFGVDTANMALLTGECIAICAACGVLSPGVCPDRWGYCGWSFINTNHELLVLEDMTKDARFADNFFVTDPSYNLVFYVGSPLISSDGHRLGTLCLFGQEPRTFDATRAQLLSNLAELLVRQLERNWVMQLKGKTEGAQLARSLASYDMAYMLVDVAKPDWRVLYMNKAASKQLGIEWKVAQEQLPAIALGPERARQREHSVEGMGLESYFNLRDSTTTWAPHCCEFTVRDVQGAAGTPLEGRTFKLTFRLAISDGLDSEQPFHVGVPAWLEQASDGFGQSLFFMQVSDAPQSSCGSTSAAAAAAPVLSSWSAALSAGDSSRSFVPRGVDLDTCPVEGLVLGPLLGRGSYGRVYRGVYHGKPVAVKMIEDVANMRTTANGEPLEAVLTRDINHLGIMRTVTYAYSPDKKSCWMLFEYCNRTCLQDAVVRGWFRTDRRPTQGGVDLRTVAVTAYEIASAMAFLHKHDIVHGDLKGGNVLLSSSTVNHHGFTAKVGDFGLARDTAVGPRLPPNTYGTVTHMPPEVLLNGELGKPTDVYSFGVMLWEMLTGARAWAGMRHTQIICQVALMKRSLAIPEGLPPAIEGLLRRCLAPEVDGRCTFEEVLSVLSDFLQTSRHDDLSSVKVRLLGDAV